MPTLPGWTGYNAGEGFASSGQSLTGAEAGGLALNMAKQGNTAGLSQLAQNAPSGAEIQQEGEQYLQTEGNILADQGVFNAAEAEVAGYAATAGAYGKVEQIAQSNAQQAQLAGGLENYQIAQEATITEAQAQAAAAGGNLSGGSAIDVLQSSRRQAGLAEQVQTVQTGLTAGGFTQQAAAAEAEVTSALGAEGAASAEATAANQAIGFNQVVGYQEGQQLQTMTNEALLGAAAKNISYTGNYNGGNPVTGAGLSYNLTPTSGGVGTAGQLATQTGNILNTVRGLVG